MAPDAVYTTSLTNGCPAAGSSNTNEQVPNKSSSTESKTTPPRSDQILSPEFTKSRATAQHSSVSATLSTQQLIDENDEEEEGAIPAEEVGHSAQRRAHKAPLTSSITSAEPAPLPIKASQITDSRSARKPSESSPPNIRQWDEDYRYQRSPILCRPSNFHRQPQELSRDAERERYRSSRRESIDLYGESDRRDRGQDRYRARYSETGSSEYRRDQRHLDTVESRGGRRRSPSPQRLTHTSTSSSGRESWVRRSLSPDRRTPPSRSLYDEWDRDRRRRPPRSRSPPSSARGTADVPYSRIELDESVRRRRGSDREWKRWRGTNEEGYRRSHDRDTASEREYWASRRLADCDSYRRIGYKREVGESRSTVSVDGSYRNGARATLADDLAPRRSAHKGDVIRREDRKRRSPSPEWKPASSGRGYSRSRSRDDDRGFRYKYVERSESPRDLSTETFQGTNGVPSSSDGSRVGASVRLMPDAAATVSSIGIPSSGEAVARAASGSPSLLIPKTGWKVIGQTTDQSTPSVPNIPTGPRALTSGNSASRLAEGIPLGPKALQHRCSGASPSLSLSCQSTSLPHSPVKTALLERHHETDPPPPPMDPPPPSDEESAPPPPPSPPKLPIMPPMSFGHVLLPTELPWEERQLGYRVTYDPALDSAKSKGKEILKKYARCADAEYGNARSFADPRRSSSSTNARLIASKRKRRLEILAVQWEWDKNSTGPKPPAPPRAVLVTGLSPLTTAAQLRSHFRAFGRVQEAELKMDPRTGQSLGIYWLKFAHDFDEDGEGQLLEDATPPGQKGDLCAKEAVKATDGQRFGTTTIVRVELDGQRDKYVKTYREELGERYALASASTAVSNTASVAKVSENSASLSTSRASVSARPNAAKHFTGVHTLPRGDSHGGSSPHTSQFGAVPSPSTASTTPISDTFRRCERDRLAIRAENGQAEEDISTDDNLEDYSSRRALALQQRMAFRANGHTSSRAYGTSRLAYGSIGRRQGMQTFQRDRAGDARSPVREPTSAIMQRIVALGKPYVFVACSNTKSGLSTTDIKEHFQMFLPHVVCRGEHGWYVAFNSQDAASRSQMVLSGKPLFGYNLDLEVRPAPRLTAEDFETMVDLERKALLSRGSHSTYDTSLAKGDAISSAHTVRARDDEPDLTAMGAAEQSEWHKLRTLAESRVVEGWTEHEIVDQARATILRELSEIFLRDLRTRVIGPHLSEFLKPDAAGGRAIKEAAAQARPRRPSQGDSRKTAMVAASVNHMAKDASLASAEDVGLSRLPSFRKKLTSPARSHWDFRPALTSSSAAKDRSNARDKSRVEKRGSDSRRKTAEDDEDSDLQSSPGGSNAEPDAARPPHGKDRLSILSQKRSTVDASKAFNMKKSAHVSRVVYSSSSSSSSSEGENDSDIEAGRHEGLDEPKGAEDQDVEMKVLKQSRVKGPAVKEEGQENGSKTSGTTKKAKGTPAAAAKKGASKKEGSQRNKEGVNFKAASVSEYSATPEVSDLAIFNRQQQGGKPLLKAKLERNKDSELSKLKVTGKKAKTQQARSPTPDPMALGIVQEDEDMYYLKLALERLQAGEPVAPSQVPDIDLDHQQTQDAGEDDMGMVHGLDVGDRKPPALAHQTGSARTEGFYKIAPSQKAAHLPDRNKAIAESTTKHGALASARDNRADSRRLVLGIEQHRKETASDTDILKFNQFRSRKKQLKFAKSPIHDWGLYAMEPIPAGDMVIEYVGEVIRQQVADHRERQYEKQGNFSTYLFRVDDDLVVDATHKGNIARLMNHCCVPNCNAKILTLNGQKRIVLYAKTTILPGQELTYDYKFQATGDEEDAIACLCGAEGCRRFL